MTQKGTKETYYNYIKKRWPNANFEVLEYETSRLPATVRCLDCGATLKVSKASKIVDRTYFCKCKNEKRKTSLEKSKKVLENQLKQHYPDADLEIIQHGSSYEPCTIRCKKCGVEKSWSNAQHALRARSFCECDKVKEYYSIEELNQSLPKEKQENFEIIVPIEYKTKEKVSVKCKKCGFIFETRYSYMLYKGITCPNCQQNYSKGEAAIANYLQNNNLTFEAQYHFYNTEIASLSFDFKVLYNNEIFLIEFQGQQHYTPIDYFGGLKAYKKQIQHDNEKRKFCINNNYHLIEIPYNKYKSIEYILNTYFGSTTSS